MNEIGELGAEPAEAAKLEKLFLSCNQLNSEDLVNSFKVIAFPNLRKLSLFGNYIEDIELVLKILSLQCPSLTELNLDGNPGSQTLKAELGPSGYRTHALGIFGRPLSTLDG